ncbi:MAG: serine/threonine protein kinase [Myxococcales bacterium]|nr:serine/threonine protein kinase [Myxococcales bacterium]
MTEATILLAGKYELLELAGEGGMAQVFRGLTHGAAGFSRPVAIKRLRDDLAVDPEIVALFVEEARVVARLAHPNVVQVHDFDVDAHGRYFLVMEWIEGLNLLDWAFAFERADQRTPWPLLCAVVIECLAALTAAHRRVDSAGRSVPIYHRDVTPQNVLLSVGGVVKLTDFGLARSMDRRRMTRPQILKGKVSYMAPELFAGAEPSVQSDLYSLGVLLWETLVGRKLFKGDSPMEVVQAIQAAKVPPLDSARPDVPAALASIVHRALDADPAARFRSAATMARSLANLLRVTPESTAADVIGASVQLARERIEVATTRPAPSAFSMHELEAFSHAPTEQPATSSDPRP